MYETEVWRVYAFVAYRVRDRETAEDLTQATFERALRAWSRFDPSRASAATWLLAIARNLVTDQHRRTAAAGSVYGDVDRSLPDDSGPSLGPSPELDTALQQLNDRDREVLALRFGGDLTGPQIAEVLGLTVANVQQILSRSLRELRRCLPAPSRAAAASGRLSGEWPAS